ncbi:MAG: response regulator [Bacteroidales bacterium]|nr:response regulator [Bacteroidales bacterium]
MTLIRIALLSLCTLLCLGAQANRHTFKTVNTDGGLSSNNVKAISQDSYGFIWLGTKGGLDRFDGRNVTHLRVWDDERNRGNDNIGAIGEDQHQRLWVGTDRGIYIYDQRKQTFRYIDTVSAEGVEAFNWLQTIRPDNEGNMWALLPDQGVFCFEGSEDKMTYYNIADGANIKELASVCMHITDKGDVYVLTLTGGLYKFVSKEVGFKPVVTKGIEIDPHSLAQLTSLPTGEIAIGARDGHIYRYNPVTNLVTLLPFDHNDRMFLRTMECYDNELWIGTYQGLYVLNLLSGEEEFYDIDDNGLCDYVIYHTFQDRDGGIWVGTLFGGVSYHNPQGMAFTTYQPLDTPRRNIRGLACDDRGNVWIGTEGNGVVVLNPTENRLYAAPKYPTHENIALMIYNPGDGTIRVGMTAQGMVKFTMDGRAECQFQGMAEDNSVYSYLIDSRGREWLGLAYGLYQRDADGQPFRRVESVGNDWIHGICEDHNGNIWLASMGTGITRISTDGSVTRFEANSHTHLRSNSVSSVMEDSKGRLWFSTDRGGISTYNPADGTFITYGIEEGLPDNVAYNIVEDRQGNLWFGTNHGLVRFKPDTKEVKLYTIFDGLPSNQFNYNSAVRDPQGRLFFGTRGGVFSLDPAADRDDMKKPELYFTQLRVSNETITPSTPESVLAENIMFTDRLTLPYDEATFSIDVISLGSNENSGRLSYRLLPVDKEWLDLAQNGRISFANLSPGNYKLVVRDQMGNHDVTKALAIRITPPWYESWWAYILFGMLLGAGALLWFYWYRTHKERQFRERQDLFMVTKEKEMNESKVRFFTEIAHEIRTPVTLISSPVEVLKDMNIRNGEARHYIEIISSNVNRLLNLTAQILDFQKIDNSKLTLKYEPTDVAELATSIVSRFEPAMKLKKKALTTNIPKEGILATIDREAITKVMSNLLNNALKYSRSIIDVSLTKDDKNFYFTVTTDGDKITGDAIRRIFEPFYQITNRSDTQAGGVGIGLPLSRRLAELHNGKLELEQNGLPERNTFVLTIPITKEGAEEATAEVPTGVEMLEEESSQIKDPAGVHSILLVEDNDQMREFIAEQLGKNFTVETAENGRIALEMLDKRPYELIITDIMMPEMDGFELCKRVKSNIDISHVPVIMLTAKNDLDTKVEGLKCGAEAYIEKPFSMKYLLQQVKSLLENRQRERNAFAKKPFFGVDNMQTNKVDEEFMNKVIHLIEEHIQDESFGAEAMGDLLAMSRSSLLRKIKSLFNMSPVELIRIVKLKKAAELIRERKYLIGDICYMVGINSPSYFSKLFFKQFGISPKDFEREVASNSSARQTVETSKDRD